MEPRIQYAKTSDGVNIAYWTMGEGMPFVVMPLRPSSHVQAEWRFPQYRAGYEAWARNRQLIRYDGRGSGLSDRDVTQFSIDTDILDLEAVVDRLGLDSFALHAGGYVGSAALSYAARRQNRVSKLILIGCSAQGAKYPVAPLIALMESNWVLYTETMAHYTLGLDTENTKVWAAFMREGAMQSTYIALMRMYSDYDVTSLLPAVQVPTLILHPNGSPIDVGAASDLAAGIPDARLVVLEGSFGVVFDTEDRAGYRAAVDEFLGLETQRKVAHPSGMTAILFADIVDRTGASATRLSGRRRASWIRRSAPPLARTTALPSKASCSAMASSPSSRARARRSRRPSLAVAPATTRPSPSTSTCTPAT